MFRANGHTLDTWIGIYAKQTTDAFHALHSNRGIQSPIIAGYSALSKRVPLIAVYTLMIDDGNLVISWQKIVADTKTSISR